MSLSYDPASWLQVPPGFRLLRDGDIPIICEFDYSRAWTLPDRQCYPADNARLLPRIDLATAERLAEARL